MEPTRASVPSPAEPEPRGLRTLAVVVLAVSLGPLPVFLLGALAVFVRADLGFGQAQLGMAVSLFFAVAAVVSISAGRLVERIGWRRGLALGAGISALGLAGMAAAPSWAVAMAVVGPAGGAVAMCQLSANLALSRGVLPRRQGLAFGVKQSAVPVATLLAGLTVPLVGLGLGWRAAFAAAAVGAAVFAVVVAAGDRRPDGRAAAPVYRGSYRRRPLLLLALAATLAMAGGNALAAFYVDAAVARGVAASAAGLGLALGSAAAVVARVGWGWAVDRAPERALTVTAGLFLAGAAGIGMLAAWGHGPALVAGTVTAFAAAWGWTGVLTFAIVRHYVANPAVASGYLLMGVYGGGTVGPLVFGAMAEAVSYTAAWWTAAGGLVLAAGLVTAGGAVLSSKDPYGRVAPGVGTRAGAPGTARDGGMT